MVVPNSKAVMSPTILIVDDSEDYLRARTGALRDFRVVTATTLAQAKDRFDATISIALVDVRLSPTDEQNREGVAFLSWAKQQQPSTPILMMSAYSDFGAAVDA